MEQLLHYTWKHKLFPLIPQTTVDGRSIEVINPGLQNFDAGPDFLNAVVKVDGMVWAGNVEMHVRTSDWFRHHHDADARYDNIILHVACIIDCELKYPDGRPVPQYQLQIPDSVRNQYDELIRTDLTPRCAKVVAELPRMVIHSWLSALQVERLEERTRQLMQRFERLDRNWEDTLFVTIARNFGFGKNGDAFELWARSIPMGAVAKHRDNLFQIESIFLGMAGMLSGDEGVARLKGVAKVEEMAKEFRYLRQKFSLTPIDGSVWKYLRLRPQNFPHVRIMQLSYLYYSGKVSMSSILGCKTLDDYNRLFVSSVGERKLSKAMCQLVVINSIVPILFAYGRYRNDEALCERAISLWESIPPEDNTTIRSWQSAGITPEHSADTQALMQLHKSYCTSRDCLRCRFGTEYMKRTPDFLKEEGL